MFDVLWTDPDRELVGEHRERKKKEKEEKRQAEEQGETENPPHTTCASESSSERFFGSRTLRKAVAPLKSRPSSKASPLLIQSKNPQQPSLFYPQESTQRDSGASRSLSDTPGHNQKLPERVPERHSRNEHFSFPSSRDSAGSKWTDRTLPTNLSPSAASFTESAEASGARTRGHSSLIAQGRGVTGCPRVPEADTFRSIPGMSVQPDGARYWEPGQPQSPEAEISEDEIDLPVDIFPGPKSPLRSIPRDWASAFKPNNPKAWKTPAEWVLATQEAGGGENAAGPSNGNIKEEDDAESRAAELRRMRREIKLMAASDPATILRQLRESWPDMTDSNQYKEVEMEKKRWMLSALYSLDGAVKMAAMAPRSGEKSPRRVLALLESPSTASYLATAHSKERVYHLSPSPLSKEQFSNIRPVVVPEQISNIPISSRIFSAAYSLSLPSLVAMNDIPHILKGLNRCLLHGATFHLTLIDPMPVATSMGPYLRNWFNKHLLKNLAKKNRCTAGSMVVPDWLSESGLRGPGSSVSRARFLAIEAKETPHANLTDIKFEARGVVGRMLWKEVWGVHVEAESWWWEDDEIVKECNQLNTFWEYYLMEAVNEVRD